MLILVLTMTMFSVVYANPVLDNVAAGQVRVTQSPNTTVVNQSSQQAIINWNSFNIAAGEKTQFVQPNASSVALNRINASQGASQIYGSLSANGRIILVNGAGIHFGPGSMVNVAGLIASTSDISNANFLSGNYIFDAPSPYAGSIINEGQIIAANHGLVALLGHNVQNNGLIQAELGNIILASGNKFTLDFYGDQLINFTVAEGTAGGSVTNKGSLLADGGKILVSAKSAAGVLDSVINMDGVAQAHSVGEQNGVIILSGGEQGAVQVSGKLDASGGTGTSGGTIKVLGNTIHLTSTAYLNTSGDLGGGTILVGGNLHGAGPEQNASTTIVDAGAIMNANSLTAGNGGTVIAWSNVATYFNGSVTATGGSLSGDGGFVETSGHYLNISDANINLLAAHGKTGIWLLDPENVIIQDNAGVDSGGSYDGSNPNIFTPISDTSIVDVTNLQNNLATANVEITTGSTGSQLGDITINTNLNWSGANILTLTAANKIYFSFANGLPDPSYNVITIAGGGLVLNAPGGIEMVSGASINTTGNQVFNGSINLTNSLYLTSSSGSIAFNGPIDGASSIEAGAALGVSINANVGSVTPISQLILDSNPGEVDTLGGDVHTTYTQTYNNPLLLNATNITLTSDATADANFLPSTIKFVSSVDSASGLVGGANLILNSPNGAIGIGNVGNTSPLASLTILPSTYAYGDALYLYDPINGSYIRTIGDQTYNNSIVVGAADFNPFNYTTNNNLIFQGTDVQLLKDSALTYLNCFGSCPYFNLQFDVSGSNSLVHGQINYLGLVKTGTGTLTMDSPSGLGFGYVSSGLTVNDGLLVLNNLSGVYIPITVNAGGQLELNNSSLDYSSSYFNINLFANSNNLDSLIATGSSSITGPNNSMFLNGSVGLGGSGDLVINSSVSGEGILIKDGTGTLTLNSGSPGTNYLLTVVNGGTLIVTNSGTFAGSLTVNSGATVNLNNAIIDSTIFYLAGNGVDGMGALVGTGASAGLTNGTINLTADASIGTLDAGDIFQINSTIDGNNNLTLAGPGTISIAGLVGNTTPLASLTANVANLQLSGGQIQTAGNQIYNSALVLQSDMTFNSQGAGNIAINNGMSDQGAGYSAVLTGATDNAFTLAGSLAVKDITVTGNAGTNSLLVQTNNPQTWTINGANSGVITGIAEMSGAFTFSNIQNLTGANTNDTFILSGGTISGNIDGAGGTNTLIPDNVANIWNITGPDSGSVTGVNAFSHIQILIGGNADNTFIFSDNASLSGQIDASASAGNNIINYSAYMTNVSANYITPTSGIINNNLGVNITTFQGIQDIIFPTIAPVIPVDPPVINNNGSSGETSDPSSSNSFTLSAAAQAAVINAVTPYNDVTYFNDGKNTLKALSNNKSSSLIIFVGSLSAIIAQLKKEDANLVASQIINPSCQ